MGRHEPPGRRPGGPRGSPDGIRTRATALRGRRARPLHNGATIGALPPQRQRLSASKNTSGLLRRPCRAGVPGLEPRLTEPESVGLPITPYPKGSRAPLAAGWAGAAKDSRRRRWRTKQRRGRRTGRRRTSTVDRARGEDQHHRHVQRGEPPVQRRGGQRVGQRARRRADDQADQVVRGVQRHRRLQPAGAPGQPGRDEPEASRSANSHGSCTPCASAKQTALTAPPTTIPTTGRANQDDDRLGEVAAEADLLGGRLQRRGEQDHSEQADQRAPPAASSRRRRPRRAPGDRDRRRPARPPAPAGPAAPAGPSAPGR